MLIIVNKYILSAVLILLLIPIICTSQIIRDDFIAFAVQNIRTDKQDSVKSSTLNDTTKNETLYVPIEKFYYADNRRYTIDGMQPLLQTKIKPIPAAIMGGVLTGIFIVQHEMQQNTIWKQTGPFNIQEDAKWFMYVDKLGHFYGTYATSYFLSECLMMTGFSWEMSEILGPALGLAYTAYVEILDGYSVGFGFSPSDFYADVGGAVFKLAQHYIPFLQNFTPKFMYVNPVWIGEQDRKPHDSFIDNYSAQTFWMSVNVYNILPEQAKKYWPSWMELSFGYAAYSLCDPTPSKGFNCDPNISEPVSDAVWGNRKFLIALDYNLAKILPDGPGFWNWFRQGLMLFKLPSPVLEIGSTTRFYLVYPFPIKIGNVRF